MTTLENSSQPTEITDPERQHLPPTDSGTFVVRLEHESDICSTLLECFACLPLIREEEHDSNWDDCKAEWLIVPKLARELPELSKKLSGT